MGRELFQGAERNSHTHAVSPKVVICSSGRPLAETYSNLQELVADFAFYNTADVGAVTVVVKEHALHVETMH